MIMSCYRGGASSLRPVNTSFPVVSRAPANNCIGISSSSSSGIRRIRIGVPRPAATCQSSADEHADGSEALHSSVAATKLSDGQLDLVEVTTPPSPFGPTRAAELSAAVERRSSVPVKLDSTTRVQITSRQPGTTLEDVAPAASRSASGSTSADSSSTPAMHRSLTSTPATKQANDSGQGNSLSTQQVLGQHAPNQYQTVVPDEGRNGDGWLVDSAADVGQAAGQQSVNALSLSGTFTVTSSKGTVARSPSRTSGSTASTSSGGSTPSGTVASPSSGTSAGSPGVISASSPSGTSDRPRNGTSLQPPSGAAAFPAASAFSPPSAFASPSAQNDSSTATRNRRWQQSSAPVPQRPSLQQRQQQQQRPLAAGGAGPVLAPELQALFKLREAGTTPRLYKPNLPPPRGVHPSHLPLLYFLPGIDGMGLAAHRQFLTLAQAFDLHALHVPAQDRTPFNELVLWLVSQLEAQAAVTPNARPIYLLGEASGALLALHVAQRCSAVDRVVLCNPATTFAAALSPLVGMALSRLPGPLSRLPLPPSRLPEPLSRLAATVLGPLSSIPLVAAARNIAQAGASPKQAADLAQGLLALLPEASDVRTALPPDTLAWRLGQVTDAAHLVDEVLPRVPQRVLLVAGQRSSVLPNAADEVARFKRLLPRCATHVVKGRAHAELQEAGVNLVDIMQEEGFYVRVRHLSSEGPASPGAASKRQGANFGAAGPLELPTPRELDLACEAGGINLLRRLVSPVFYSKRADGTIVRGIEGVPDRSSGPLLFVGPHPLMAPDMPIMIEKLLRERGMLLRGMAHPLVLQGPVGGQAVTSLIEFGPGAAIGNFLATFGAVAVNGKNMHQLFSQGEAVLMYPGGTREGFKYKDERHRLFWPSRTEFVRMAARFGATIVPFAHVGAEDSIDILLDGRELLSLPILGDRLRERAAKLPQARQGVSLSVDNVDTFVQPLVAPKAPARFYFLFGKPVVTRPEMTKDKAACDALYAQVKGEVEGGMAYLLRQRELDPYADLSKRLLYEFASGGKSAPSFDP